MKKKQKQTNKQTKHVPLFWYMTTPRGPCVGLNLVRGPKAIKLAFLQKFDHGSVIIEEGHLARDNFVVYDVNTSSQFHRLYFTLEREYAFHPKILMGPMDSCASILHLKCLVI